MTVEIITHEIPKHHLFKNLTGCVFGRLTVVSYAGRTGKRNIHTWICLCECGNTHLATSSRLGEGAVKSCGCYLSDYITDRNRTHGMKGSPEYNTWAHMKGRCSNPNVECYKNYGARGITVCDEWVDSFEQFYKDMGDRPEAMSIDRVDNDKGYSKDNCKWSTAKEQANNRRVPKRRKHLAGVRKTGCTWHARISVNGRYVDIGTFDDWFDAVCARKSAELW